MRQGIGVANDARLRPAIAGIANGDTILFTADITLLGDLPVVQKNITIDGQNHTLSGNNLYRGFFIAAWTPGTATMIAVSVEIKDLTIQNVQAQGGTAAAAAAAAAGAAEAAARAGWRRVARPGQRDADQRDTDQHERHRRQWD